MDIRVKRVPSEYVEVEYIQSDGAAYIDTGLMLTSESKTELVLEKTNSQTSAAVFGARDSADSKNIGIAISYPSFPLYSDFTNSGYASSRVTLVTFDNGKYKIVLDKKKRQIFDGNGTLLAENTVVSGTFTTTKNAYIFNQNGSYSNILFNGRIYYCKIYENNKLVRDFIPVYSKTTNEYGMYDLVTYVFYGSAGTGVFTGGSEISTIGGVVIPEGVVAAIRRGTQKLWTRVPWEYTEVEYIQSSGTEYIDLDMKGNQNTKVDLSYILLSRETQTIFGARTNVNTDSIMVGVYMGSFELLSDFCNYTKNRCYTGAENQVIKHTRKLDGSTVSGTVATAEALMGKKIRSIISKTENKMMWDNHTLEAIGQIYENFETPSNLLLFSANNVSWGSKPLKVYNCKIWNGNTLVRDLVPVKKLDTNEYGMYDLVMRQFYGNSGTGAFTGGPAK